MGNRRHSQGLTAKHPKQAESLGHRHHNFTVELFLDEKDEASDIFIDHGQSGEKAKLTSWEPEKLIDFIARHAGLQTTQLVSESPARSHRHASRNTSTKSHPEMTPALEPALAPTAPADFVGIPRLRDLKVVSADSDNPDYLLRQGQPFTVRLTLDLTKVVVARKVTLIYEATVIARQPGGPDQPVGEARRRIEASKTTTISVASSGLPQGMYRLDAVVRLASADAKHGHQAGAVAYLEGDLLEVY